MKGEGRSRVGNRRRCDPQNAGRESAVQRRKDRVWFGNWGKCEKEENVAQEGNSDSDHVILMVTSSGGEHNSDSRFLT